MAPIITGDTLITAKDEQSARKEFEASYPIKVITSVIDCSTPEYQSDFDRDRYDNNGRYRY